MLSVNSILYTLYFIGVQHTTKCAGDHSLAIVLLCYSLYTIVLYITTGKILPHYIALICPFTAYRAQVKIPLKHSKSSQNSLFS